MDLRSELSSLLLDPVLKSKIWGGTALQRLFGYQAPSGDCIGEAWLANGDSVIAGGEGRGGTLADVVSSDPGGVLGPNGNAGGAGRFPLLAKFLDAESPLSVQVHPPDEYARAHEGVPFGKAEAWYIIEAQPEACVFHGTAQSIGPEELVEALKAGKAAEVLAEIPVRAGDVIMNPPGTIHALGGGVVLYEIQQSSDVTYRLYDWDRPSTGPGSRELHIRQGLEVATLDPLPQHTIQPVTMEEEGITRSILCASKYFCAELLHLEGGMAAMAGTGSFHLLTQLRGSTRVSSAGGSSGLKLSAGYSAVVPAAWSEYRLDSMGGNVSVLRAYVPDLAADIIRPLLERGIRPDTIAQLGGHPTASDLSAALARLR